MPAATAASPAPKSSRLEPAAPAAPQGPPPGQESRQARRRRVLIILNPEAGRSSARQADRVAAALRRRGVAVEVRRTGSIAGDAERLAKEAEPDFEAVVAAGGDGTLHGVVNGVGEARVVALLPCGTANVLARDIGLPRRPEALAELIAGGPAQPVWPGRVGDRLFLTAASSGFDAETVAALDLRLKRRFGRLAFVWAMLTCLLRYQPRRLTVRADGVEYPAASMIAAKGRLYAGRFVIAPDANLSEPVLDLVLFQRSGRIAVLRYLGALLFGCIPRGSGVVSVRCREAVVSADGPVPVQADGELVGDLPVALGIAERPLLFIRP
jgi:diacylglycerol kinase (ATP)